MLRRRLIIAAPIVATLGAWSAMAWAQGGQSQPPQGQQPTITPQNALEYAFVSALTNQGMRPIFRRYLLETHVALALTSEDENSAPREVRVREGFNAGAIFTSEQRLIQVLGEDAPHIMINGRAALTRLVGKNVVINPGLAPMLTLEPTDVAAYLATPGESSAGPTQ